MKAWRQRALGLTAAFGLLTHSRVYGEDKTANLPPEFTAKCTEFLQKVNAARRPKLDEQMAAEIAEVTKSTGLGADGGKVLSAAATLAENAAESDLLAKALEMYAKAYGQIGGRGLAELDRPEVAAAAARSDSGFESAVRYTHAPDQPAWKDALAKVLTPEQAAAWAKAEAGRAGTVPQDFEDLLDRQADQIRTTITSPMFTKSTEIIDTLGLPKDRAEAISGFAKQAIDASMAAWRKEGRRTFLGYDAAMRAKVARSKQMYFPPRDEDGPENQAVWTEGLAKVLSDDDRAKLQVSHGLQRQRRTHALALLMVALLDEKVAFTTVQRPKLEPIMERLVQKVGELYPAADGNNDYSTLSTDLFYKAAAGAQPDEMHAILDDLQWKHWQDISHEKGQPNPNDEEEEETSPTPTPKPAGTTIEEPEDLEQMVSDYLATKSATEHRELDAAMLLEAEDAARVAALPPAAAARLRTAAHGAAEVALVAWSASLEQTIRGQVQGATRETVQQRLNNGSRYYFGQPTAREQTIWTQATKSDLTPAQQQAWQLERDARAQYNEAAVAEFVLAEFDRNFSLHADQWDRLAPLLQKALHDYRPDIGQMFSYNSPQWYLSSYYMFLPVHAIPEEECKEILGKERFDHWTESSGYRYSVQYFSNLKQYHEQRTKEDKK